MTQEDIEKARLKLEARLDKSGDCWIWLGPVLGYGYGYFKSGKIQYLTHRIAWELANGPIPDGLCVCHKCDTPPCCNPNHLFLGTRKENTQDMLRKGRWPTKVTAQNVLDIRDRFARGDVSQISLAREYGVSYQLISVIIKKGVWTHI